MLTRKEIKERAKRAVSGHYGISLGLYLLPVLVFFGVYLVIMFATVMPIAIGAVRSGAVDFDSTTDLSMLPTLILSLVVLVSGCVLAVMMVGAEGGYTRLYRGLAAKVSEPFTSLRRNFWRKLGSLMKVSLLVLLWCLPGIVVYSVLLTRLMGDAAASMSYEALQGIMMGAMLVLYALLIPAYIKALSYLLTPYILAEYPDVKASDAIRLSTRMTKGYKGQLFLAYLSFFWWYLLNAITFGVLGIFYVAPYQMTTFAGFYTELRNQAVTSGAVSLEELGESSMQLPPAGEQQA